MRFGTTANIMSLFSNREVRVHDGEFNFTRMRGSRSSSGRNFNSSRPRNRRDVRRSLRKRSRIRERLVRDLRRGSRRTGRR
jgi:hypothetical protein